VILIDRFVITRFLSNFLMLFGLLFIFAISIDVIVQFDEFSEAATRVAREENRSYAIVLVHGILEFHGPRIFQFYAYMVGLVGVAAAGFTLAQMHRNRELVAIMASGTSLHRVGAAILVAEAALVGVQLIDQELILPKLAPKLIREHQQILKPSVETFAVPLTRDSEGNLLYARSMDARAGKATGLLFLLRDSEGPALERITARSGQWDPQGQQWILSGGEKITAGEIAEPGQAVADRVSVDAFATNLSPERLMVRRSLQFAQLLSVSQLSAMAGSGGVDRARLGRVIYGRFSGALVNLLVLAIALPFFLLREPANMLVQSLKASVIVIPVLVGSLAAMTLEMPGLSPGVGAFLPVAVLLPIAIGRAAYLRT